MKRRRRCDEDSGAHGRHLHWIHHGHGGLSDHFTGYAGEVRVVPWRQEPGRLEVDRKGDKRADIAALVKAHLASVDVHFGY